MINRNLLTLSMGHAFTDMNIGALPAMLPFIIAAGGLNYTQAAGLTFAAAFSSSLAQPFFGIMADKMTKTWLLPVGVLLAGCGVAAIGFFPGSYWIMFTAAVICGIGSAAYHPEGARMANRLSGKKKAGNMSIFTVGGNVGIGIGPLIATPALIYLGMRGSAVLALPAIFMCILFFFLTPRMLSQVEINEREEKKSNGELRNEWGKFLYLGIAIVSRSIISHNLNTFLPLYWINVLHQSKAASGMVLSFIFFIGSIVTIISGQLADRFGIGRVIKIGWILLIPSFAIFTFTTNPVLALLVLVPITTGNFMVNTPIIVLGQKYLPKNIGFASGVTLGLGVSIGGITGPIFGSYADIHGLTATLRLLCFLPVLGTIVAFTSKPPAR